jgi:hypothetical protein
METGLSPKEGDKITLISPDGTRVEGVFQAFFHGEPVLKIGRLEGYLYAFLRDGYQIADN